METVEFIESYKKVGNDYQWSDNHGELIRCRDCKYYNNGAISISLETGERIKLCAKHPWDKKANNDDWYCADGERKEE